MATPQSTILVADIPIHETHCMGFEPCLFLECSKCGLSVKANARELAAYCEEDLIQP